MTPTHGPLSGRPILTTWSQIVEDGHVRGTRTHVTVADDELGQTWGPLLEISMQNGSTFTGGPMTQLDATTFLQTGYVYAPGDLTEARCVQLEWAGTAFSVGEVQTIARSDDGSWFSEPNTVLLPDGRVLALLRNGHSPGPLMIWSCFSSDNGRSWSAPKPAFVGSGAPHMTVTSRGAVFVVYRDIPESARECDDVPYGRMDAVYRVSTDAGETWGPQRSLGVHSQFEMSYGVPLETAAGSFTVVHGSETDGHHSVVLATRDVIA